ncbi:MAG: hypothetical protein VXY83_02195 [Pseudomonadota bacterium]|nr:hypothetical protein [Pseudomonadota bacterium]
MKKFLFSAFLVLTMVASHALADTVIWRGPTHTLTLGLNEDDISHVEFPEEIVNITLENSDYVDILVVEGYGNKAFRMRSLLPKMATRMFMTGASGATYIVVLTTDVPYRQFVQIVDGQKIDSKKRQIASQFGVNDMLRAMAEDRDIPGVVRETYVVPNWFTGAGLTFELSEVWQSPKFTGLVVHVQNEYPTANEVNIPAISIPKTGEWGVLRKAAMENMRLAGKGQPSDQGVMFLLFER